MERMFRLLKADEIECRVSRISEKGLSLLLYKDARVDQNILDETVGPGNWTRSHELINGNLFCNVGIRIKREDGSYEWVYKQDVGTESYTEKEKGQASDSFKRACFNWGIGRELYTAPFIWIPAGKFAMAKGSNGKPTTYDRFDVTGIEYSPAGAISFLEITNEKMKDVSYTFGKRIAKQAEPKKEAPKPEAKKAAKPEAKPESKPEPEASQPDPEDRKPYMQQRIDNNKVIQLRMLCKKHEFPEEKVYGMYNHKSMDEMTYADWASFCKVGAGMLKAWDEERAG